MLVYCTGMSQPPNGIIFALRRTCSWYSGVVFCAVSLTPESLAQVGAIDPFDCAQGRLSIVRGRFR
jgi:hypothetical protein